MMMKVSTDKFTIYCNFKIKHMKKLLFGLLFFTSGLLIAQPSRKEVIIPDIMGYKTVKCDVHIHTVFSDGLVWPTYRVDEAWQEGLDAIAITDHIEYRPLLKDDLNKSYQLALPRAQELGIMLIPGVEITKSMPPGHLNALFITDANTIEDKDALTSIRNAAKQGAFVVWNHPGWKAQQPDTVRWWDIHSLLYNEKIMNGIEVVGYEQEYFPEAHRWANEKGLTMIGATDIHVPIKNEFTDYGSHRTMTVAFAKECTLESLKEAFFAGRTVVFGNGSLYGREQYLKAIFDASVSAKKAEFRNKKYTYVMVHNSSDIPYQLVAVKNPYLQCIKQVTLKPQQTTLVEIKGISEGLDKMATVQLPIIVKNLLVEPSKPVELILTFENDIVAR